MTRLSNTFSAPATKDANTLARAINNALTNLVRSINASQVVVKSGDTFPATPVIGQSFLLTADITDFNEGLYNYDGSDWISPGSAIAFENGGVLLTNSPMTIDAGSGIVATLSGDKVTLSAEVSEGTGTDLSQGTRTATTVVVVSSTGEDATLSSSSTTEAGLQSATDKTKLDGIEAGAEVNVKSDWNAVSGDAQILNKPDATDGADGLDAITTYILTNDGDVFKNNDGTDKTLEVHLIIGADTPSASDYAGYNYKWTYLNNTICVDNNRNVLNDANGNPLVSSDGMTCSIGGVADSSINTGVSGSLRAITVGPEDVNTFASFLAEVSNIPE